MEHSKTRQALQETLDEEYAELTRKMPTELSAKYTPSDFNVLRWWGLALSPVQSDVKSTDWRNRTAVLAAELMKTRREYESHLRRTNDFSEQVMTRLERLRERCLADVALRGKKIMRICQKCGSFYDTRGWQVDVCPACYKEPE